MASSNICRYFATTGNCFYGDQCNFSHVLQSITSENQASHLQTPSVYGANVANATSPQKSVPKNLIPCRNVALYGHCKYMGKGCEYNHDNVKPGDITGQFQAMNLVSPDRKDGSSPYDSPSYVTPPYTLTANAVNAPAPQAARPPPDSAAPVQVSKRGGTIYFYNNTESQQQQQQESAPSKPRPLQYNLHTALPHVATPGRRSLSSFFMAEDLRREIMRKTALINTALDPLDPRAKGIPLTVSHYHSLFPLDDPQRPPNNSLCGYPTSTYKCINSLDGLPYVIRKIEGFRLSNEHALGMGEMWKLIRHPNVIGLSEIFISKDFGDTNSVFFAYHYHPGAESLETKYFSRKTEPIPESLLWSYICQLVSALRTIHQAGLACKNILLSRILVTEKNRIRINSVGIQDVVNYDGGKNIPHMQHDDLVLFGQLILLLTTRSTASPLPQNLVKSLDYLSANYSLELKNLVILLLGITKANAFATIEDVVSLISRRLIAELDHAYTNTDQLEGELMKEYENGRLFRMMVKLGFINERPEFELDPSWSETGDRYLLKLFRDYVFHQVYEDGTPVVDLAHVVECLNKLDLGSEEKIVLMSRDEQSVLIASYKDLKRCVEDSFNELQSKKNAVNYHVLR